MPEDLEPGAGLNLQNPTVICDLFQRAAKANLDAALRRGATVHLPDHGRVIMTGDLHDNGLNFQRILKLAELGGSDSHHVILHEVIHGEHRINDRDMSVRMLARVAALKLQFPEQVHLLQANHELAQLLGEGIIKDGYSVVAAFDRGIDFLFGDEADAVRAAMNQFIRSFLVAVKCPKGIMLTHSLPSPREIEKFDTAVIDRVPTDVDLSRGGVVHSLVWGRFHGQSLADHFAKAWGVKLFVIGHQPAEMGYDTEGDSILIVNSDHAHGVALPIDLSRDYDRDTLIGELVPLASVVL